MHDPCPDPLFLVDYLAGALAPERHPLVERHLSLCSGCRAAVARPLQLEAELPGYWGDRAAPAIRWPGVRWRWMAAAASAAAILVSATFGFRSSRPARAVPFEQGAQPAASVRRISGGPETLARPELVELPDGTRLRIGGRTTARLAAAREGERCRLVLERGEIEVVVARASGTFLISNASGEIEVLGTHFTARALEFEGLGKALCADLHDGKILLRSDGGESVLQGSMRGVSFTGAAPFRQERGGSIETALRQFGQVVEWRQGEPRIDARQREGALLVAATAWGFHSGGLDRWIDAIRRENDPARRAAGYLLLGLGHAEGAQAALEAFLESEGDTGCRAAIRKAMACLEPEGNPR